MLSEVFEWSKVLKVYEENCHLCEGCIERKCENCLWFLEGTTSDYCQLWREDIKAEAPPCKYFMCYYFLRGFIDEDTAKWCKILKSVKGKQ